MAKEATFPTLLDEVKTISIAFLKQHGYLIPGQVKSGRMTWSSNGVETSSINIMVNMKENFVELDYKASGDPVCHRINLIQETANIANGTLWFFECPRTLLHCRKLFYCYPYFLHRKAHKGSMYSIQTYSANTREKIRLVNDFHEVDEQYRLLSKKHFRTHYKGKTTKRYLRIMRKIEKGERISLETYERLFMI